MRLILGAKYYFFYTFRANYSAIVKITIHPKYNQQQEAIVNLTRTFFQNDRVLVEGSRNSIKTSFLGDEEVNIKFFQKPGIIKSIIYSFFKSTKAKRSYDYAHYLIEHAILTPFPIAYVEERKLFGLLGNSFYISHQVNCDFTFRELIHNPKFPEREAILKQFTAFTYKMHEAKIHFQDHSPGNTLIVKRENGVYDFYLIDLNRMKFDELSLEQRMDNFKKLWLSKQMIHIIAKEYAQLAQQPEELVLKLLMEKSRLFKQKTARKKYIKRFLGKK